jgi:hypothetical protein
MSWLTSAWLFYGGFLFALVAPFIPYFYFGRIPGTGKTYRQSFAESSKQSFDDIRGRLDQLLRCGFDQGFVIFKFQGSDCFIQFRKYIHAKGDYGLELGFPKADWSRDYFPLVAECCTKNHIPYTIGPHNIGDDMEFLHADVGKDTDAAFRLVGDIVDHAFRISRDTDYTLEWDAIDPTGGLIDSPNQTLGKRQQQFSQEFFEKTGLYMSDIPVVTLWLFAFLVGGVGLIYALFWWLIWAAMGVNADWGAFDVRIGESELAIRNFQLFSAIALLSAFLLGRIAALRRMRTSMRDEHSEECRRKRSRRRAFVWRILIPLLLSATIASWVRW